MATSIHVLNGPNLNLLGGRETDIYGSKSLDQIERDCREIANELQFDLVFKQTNHEGELVDWIQDAGEDASAVIINPGAYGHTSIALYDAIRAIKIPVIEVHISNIHAREPFRRKSMISPVSLGMICGFGPIGYVLAVRAVAEVV